MFSRASPLKELIVIVLGWGDSGMKRQDAAELLIRSGIYIISLVVVLKLFIPIISPAVKAADINISREYFYEALISNTVPSVGAVMDRYEDEDRKELLAIVFDYATGIDLTDPSTYIASQIPLLGLMDSSVITSGSESGIAYVEPTTKPGNIPEPSGVVVPIPTNGQVDQNNPIVFIYHTHTTENYNPNLEANKNFSTDLTTTVAAVGDALEAELENTYGISAVHDKTIHDIPLRDEGYSKSKTTLQKYLKQYPSVKIAIDLHRDGDVSKEKATAILNGTSYARTMFVLSTNSSVGNNKNLVASLNGILDTQYPGFSRGVSYSKYRYNQDLFDGCVLIEVGSNTNSFQEAITSTKPLAKMLSEYFKNHQ
jgi:stage II sporulation protein P